MALVETINNSLHFAEWLKQSDNYKNNFSFEGAKAVQEYYEELSESMGEPVEFDPIAWCCEFSEYASVAQAYEEQCGDDLDLPEEQRRTTEDQQLEYFEDNTTVIELENGRVIIGEF